MKIAQTYSIFNVKCCAGNVFSPFTTDKHKQGQGHKWHQWSFTHILDKRDQGLSPLFLPWDVYCLSSQWSGGGLRSRPTMWGRWEGLGKSFEWREITTRVALYITMESWTWGRAMWQTSLQLAIKHQGETADWNDHHIFFLTSHKIACCNHCHLQPPECEFYKVIATHCSHFCESICGLHLEMW